MTPWRILYRGSLSSCNYDCSYCPFAKTTNTVEQLAQDRKELERFVDWVSRQKRQIGILFTPWGEALGHPAYRQALVRLSSMPHINRVSIQTNLSATLNDLSAANRNTLALWSTFHPTQTSVEEFLKRCAVLELMGIRYSVGVVGLREHFPAIEALRNRLPAEVYVWVNAFKTIPDYYQPGEVDYLARIDPYFRWNLYRYPSLGGDCQTGDQVFSVDGAGEVRRCHFVPARIGNIYDDDFEDCLRPRPCPVATCGCHIGYVHRPLLDLGRLFGGGLLERIPDRWPQIEPAFVNGPALVD